MQKALIIHNPIAGTQNPESLKQKVCNALDDKYIVNHIFTKSANHADEICIGNDFHNADVVIACGGDGTVNQIAKYCVKSQKKMAIIPIGSGNGLSRSLGIQTVVQSLNNLKKGNFEFIDVVRINNDLSFNVAGLGFDAHVSKLFARVKKRGFLTYIKIVLKELRHRSYEMEIAANGEQVKSLFWLLSIANSNQWGNNIIINPVSSVQDNQFELIGIQKLELYQVPKFLYYLLRNRINLHPSVTIIAANKAEIKVSNAPLHIDGDYVENVKEKIEVEIHTSKLQLLIP